MTFQYGDLRVDELTYTSGSADTTVTVSGLVAKVNGAGGGTFDGDVTITGDLTVTADITTDTITGTVANFTTVTGQTGTFETISGNSINEYASGKIVTLSGTTLSYTTISGTTVTGGQGNFANLSGTVITGGTINGGNGVFTSLSGATITGDTVNVKSGVFSFITGADAHFGSLSADDIVFPGDETVNNFTVTGVLTAAQIVASGISATVITGTTVTGNHAQFTSGTFQNITVTETISGQTITGSVISGTVGQFETISGPIASETVTGVSRIATTAEANSATGPSGTYTDTVSGTNASPFFVNPSDLRNAFRSYDPIGNPVDQAIAAETGTYARQVITTGTFNVDGGIQIDSITWTKFDTSVGGTPVTTGQAISAVAPSGTYAATVSGDANTQAFYNPFTLREAFKAYDPQPTGEAGTIYARTVSGVTIGGELVATGYEWVKIPTGVTAIATNDQAAAAAGASGTYSSTPVGGAVIINPENLRSAFKNYDPQPPAGTTRTYARQVSGLTGSTITGETWIDIGDVLQGDFLPTTGGTVSGDVTITGQLTVGEQLIVQSQGLIVTGDVRHSGNTSMSGNLDVNGHINAQFNSSVTNVLFQVNGSAQRGIFQGPNAGVALAKGGRQIVEFTSTGTSPAKDFALLSGDLRVGNNAEEIGNLNTSQFWAFERGNFASASDDESEIWRNRTDDVKVITVKSSVGGNRSEVFGIGTSGQIFLSGSAGTSGQFIMSNGAGQGATYSSIQATPGGDLTVHDLTVTGNATFSSGVSITGAISLSGDAGVFPQVLISSGTAGSHWSNTAAQGSGTDQVFFLNQMRVTTDYTIPSGMNATSCGPIIIEDGITVTVNDDQNWSIV